MSTESKKPYTLQLADRLISHAELGGGDLADLDDGAAELRRLHTEHTKLQADYATLYTSHGELVKLLQESSKEIAEIISELKKS